MEYESVLVTGVAGLIGSHMVEALVASNVKTWVLDHLSSGSLRNLSGCLHDSRLDFVHGTKANFQP